MKVVDVDERGLSAFYSSVGRVISEKEDWCDSHVLVVGIATAGVDLAKGVSLALESEGVRTSLAFIRCQRPSTKNGKKKSKYREALIASLLRKMPRFFVNALRNIEHFLLQSRGGDIRDVSILDGVEVNGFSKVLIVDDAIDSGHSFRAVSGFLEAIVSEADLYSCVYVTTQKRPVFSADYSHKDGVLVRFPWSLDAR